MVSLSLGAGRGLGRADKLLAVLAVLAMVALHLATGVIDTLERRFYDFASTLGTRPASDRIAIVAIDEASIAAIGRWPWSREVHAGLIDRLGSAGASVIVPTTFFFEPQAGADSAWLHRLRQAMPAQPPAALARVLREAEDRLDPDARLAESIRRAGNVLLPALFTLGGTPGRGADVPPWLAASAAPVPAGIALPASRVQLPIESLGAAAAGVGHLNHLVDADGAVRELPLLVDFRGLRIPSVALLALARDLQLHSSDIRLAGLGELRVGGLSVRTDAQARLLPHFHRPPDGQAAFSVDSFHEVASGAVPARRFQGKIVLVGATAAGLGPPVAAPGLPGLAPVELLAHSLSSLLQAQSTIQPAWAAAVSWGTAAVVALWLVFGLPRLRAGPAALVTGLAFGLLLGVEFALLLQSLWLKLVFPASLLLAGYLALTTRRLLAAEAGKLRAERESAEANRMIGLALQGQGQLDMAFDRFRRVPLSDELMDNLHRLALDFERRRQFNKAEAVYRHMAGWDAGYKDLRARCERAAQLAHLGTGGERGPGGTLVLGGTLVEKPLLGRYQLERELGKGAMGVVYLGRDPRIGRTVAIKTFALGQAFDGGELDQARRRFLREAEAAGRLVHPNIVTVFDAGEEHDLAYMAMELLHGRDLAASCQPGRLLPPATVLSVVARVADALAYAHAQGVVHRDIKPANIMYEPVADIVKVTDFGVARLTDASHTRTGTILGTPSYMSPEQVAGRPLDGRSDLYSLGVILFQLLTGSLPFSGGSITETLYRAMHDEPPDVRERRPELPEGLARLVARALARDPDQRPSDGLAFAAALRACGQLLEATPARGYDPSRSADDSARMPAPLATGNQFHHRHPGDPPAASAPGETV